MSNKQIDSAMRFEHTSETVHQREYREHQERFYREGEQASLTGKYLVDCPYRRFTKKRREWEKGFNAAKEDMARKADQGTNKFLENDCYRKGWQAYQEGHGPMSPYLIAEPYTSKDYEKHNHWLKGYKDSERSADPDGLVPRGAASYVADINIPRERLFSIKDKAQDYYIFVMTFNTKNDARMRILYIRARSQSEAFGHVYIMTNRKSDVIRHWRIEHCPLDDLQLVLEDSGVQMFEHTDGSFKETAMPEPVPVKDI